MTNLLGSKVHPLPPQHHLKAFMYPYTTVCVTPSWADFSWSIDIAMVGIVTVPKMSALETSTSRRELSGDVTFDIGTLLVVEQSSSENLPRGVSYAPSYTEYS